MMEFAFSDCLFRREGTMKSTCGFTYAGKRVMVIYDRA